MNSKPVIEMLRLLLLLPLLLSCGPSWSDVRQHPGGIYENVRTGECWNEAYEPVICPREK